MCWQRSGEREGRRETGSVFGDFSINEVMLLVSGNLNHKQMFYLEYLSVVYLALALSLSPRIHLSSLVAFQYVFNHQCHMK